MTQINPYINFKDSARAALEFYQSALGGELTISEFSDFPDMGVDASESHLIMHGQLATDDGLTLMAADTPSHMPYAPQSGFAVSLSGDDAERLQAAWDALTADGTVTMPYDVPPWGGRFSMFTDKFGVDWMIALNAAS